MTAAEVFEKIRKCETYFRASGGGVTASGGEPLLQPAFLRELFTLCRAAGIHTAIDTSGFINHQGPSDEMLGLTDLFIIDLKWADPARHRELTGRSLDEPLALINELESLSKPYWVRNVLVPGLNDSDADLLALRSILAPLRHCERFEFLPYHTLGMHKWAALNKPYPLKDYRPATDPDMERALQFIDIQSP